MILKYIWFIHLSHSFTLANLTIRFFFLLKEMLLSRYLYTELCTVMKSYIVRCMSVPSLFCANDVITYSFNDVCQLSIHPLCAFYQFTSCFRCNIAPFFLDLVNLRLPAKFTSSRTFCTAACTCLTYTYLCCRHCTYEMSKIAVKYK